MEAYTRETTGMPVAVGRCAAVGSSCVFSGVLRIHSIALRILGRIFTPPFNIFYKYISVFALQRQPCVHTHHCIYMCNGAVETGLAPSFQPSSTKERQIANAPCTRIGNTTEYAVGLLPTTNTQTHKPNKL